MSRREQIVITVLVVAVFSAPLVLLAFGVRSGFNENRERTAAPTFTARSATNDATWAQLGDYLTDRLPLRDRAIALDADVRSRLTVAEAADEGVPRGEDGWLYHDATLLDECGGPPPAAFFETGEEIPARADRANTPFLFVLIPDKVVVYREHQVAPGLTGPLGLAGGMALPGCAATWVDALVAAAPSRDWLLDLRPALLEAREDTDVYYKTDSHWTDAGAAVFVQSVLDRIEPGIFDPSDVRATGRDVSRDDLALLSGSSQDDPQPQLEVVRRGVTVVEPAVRADDNEAQILANRSRATSTDAPLVEGTTVIVGDSFTRFGGARLLAPYFEELVFLQYGYLQSHTIGDALEGGTADRIIVAEVQRIVAMGLEQHGVFFKAVNHHLTEEQDGA